MWNITINYTFTIDRKPLNYTELISQRLPSLGEVVGYTKTAGEKAPMHLEIR